MVVTVTCKHCGFEYQSKVLRTPDGDSLIYEPREGVMENCPKGNQISNHVAARHASSLDDTFFTNLYNTLYSSNL